MIGCSMKTVVLFLLSGVTMLSGVFADIPLDLARTESAAKEGDAAAQLEMARAYYRGIGVEKNLKTAMEWLKKAAESGNPEALTQMGVFYFEGTGVPKDEKEALAWFRKAAEAGSTLGQLNLGVLLRQGKEIERSNEESLEWIHKAADGGRVEAKMVLGQLYFTGDSLQRKDYAKAVPYLAESAALGEPVCQNMMGVACRDGLGTEMDHQAAEKWFRKAALQNDRKAQANLAHLLGAPSPASPHREEALKWLLVSMGQGEITAEKTYKEIFATLPPALLASAKKEADRFLLIQRTKGAKPAAEKLPDKPAPTASPSKEDGAS